MTVKVNPQPTVPGVEARAGKFRGPSLIPMLVTIQDRFGLGSNTIFEERFQKAMR